MSKIPPELLAELLADPFYKGCARAGWHKHICDGKITFEHSLIFGGKQLQLKFAIIPLCEKAHAVNRHQDGGDLNKEINVWIALSRATPDEIWKISKAVNYTHKLKILSEKFGVYAGPLKPYTPKPQKTAVDLILEKITNSRRKYLHQIVASGSQEHLNDTWREGYNTALDDLTEFIKKEYGY